MEELKKSELKRRIQELKQQFNTTGKNKKELESMLRTLQGGISSPHPGLSGSGGSGSGGSGSGSGSGTGVGIERPRPSAPIRIPNANSSFHVPPKTQAQGRMRPQEQSTHRDEAVAFSQNVLAKLYNK